MTTTNLRVLYVDDDDDIRAIVEMALALDESIDLRLAGSGEEAIELVRSAGWRPDVVILDVMMPGLSGPATLQRIEAITTVSAIFMTAHVRSCDLSGFRRHAVVGVITKPFDPLQLAYEIRMLAAAG
jgi:CheY-like chemotaxis protein